MTASDRQTVTELQAQSATNLFLSDHLPDRFTADQPVLNSTRDTWHVPVIGQTIPVSQLWDELKNL
jgi:hypothetical protein